MLDELTKLNSLPNFKLSSCDIIIMCRAPVVTTGLVWAFSRLDNSLNSGKTEHIFYPFGRAQVNTKYSI